MRSSFYVAYRDFVNVKLVDKSLGMLLKSAYMSRKPIMFCIASPNGRHESFISLFDRAPVLNKIVKMKLFRMKALFSLDRCLTIPNAIKAKAKNTRQQFWL